MPEHPSVTEFREFLVELKIAKGKIEEVVDQFAYVSGFGPGNTVEVEGARVAVDVVEVYGLSIELDANGNAVAISSPHGLFMTD